MLKLRYSDNRRPPFWATGKIFSIGRSKSNHLCIDDDSVALIHARIFNRGDTFMLKDAGSQSGTYVNGTRVTQRNIGCGDQISIGDIKLEIVDPLSDNTKPDSWALIANSSWLSGQEFPLPLIEQGDKVTLGRSKHCDIVIPGTHLAQHHAEILMRNRQLFIRDLGSANGTYLNDKKVRISLVNSGDQIRIDVYTFKVFGPGIALPNAATQTRLATSLAKHKARKSTKKRRKIRTTSPGNRSQENLYKNSWWPMVIAILMLCVFIGGLLIYLLTDW